MRRIGLGLVLAMVLASCMSQPLQQGAAIIDWIDMIRLNGVTYVGTRQPEDVLAKLKLGMAIGQVNFRLQGNVGDPNYKVKDGDAAFLDPGTPIRSLEDYAPTFRVAVQVNGTTTLYEATKNINAQRGADMWDLQGKVTKIDVISMEDGTTVLGSISDAAQIEAIVADIAAAPVQQDDNVDGEGDSYMVSFNFKDGTTFKPVLYSGNGLLWPTLFISQTSTKAILAAAKK